MKLIPYVLLLLLVRLPIINGRFDLSLLSDPSKWGGVNKRFSMFISWFIVACLLIASKVWKYNKPLSCLFVLCIFSSFYPVYKGFTVSVIAVVLAMVWYLYWVESSVQPLNAICVICLIHLALLFSQYFKSDPVFHLSTIPTPYRHVGFFMNINFCSMFIAVCFSAFLRKRWFYFIPFLVAGLIIARSTGGVIAIVTTCIFALFFTKIPDQSKLIVFAILCFLFACFYQYVDRPGLSRWEDWKVFSKLKKEDIRPRARFYYNKIDVEKILARPYQLRIFGFGLGAFKSGKIEYRKRNYTHAHNDFLEGYLDLGVLVIPIYLWFFFNLITRFKKNIIPGMALIIGCVGSCTGYFIFNPTIAAVLIVWLAMFDRIPNNHRNLSHHSNSTL